MDGGTNAIVPYASSEERTWCILVHLSALTMFFIPFGNLLVPLVIWLIKRADMPTLDRHGKESLNFQITVTIASILCSPLVFVGIGILLLGLIVLANIALVIVASVKASDGKAFAYPLTFRILK